jgi:hypothetical protein
MKTTILLLSSFLMVGCTTGSKYRYIENNYTNVQSFGQTGNGIHQFTTPDEMNFNQNGQVVYEKPIYIYDEKDATMGDLGKAIGRKMLRKMYAAYNTN